jgi:hypothetical protein
MVVLTDGIENVPPFINDVITGPSAITTTDPNLRIFSVGVGPDGDINPAAIQSITNVSQGFHQVAHELDDIHLFDLEAFFFKIFTATTDWSIVVDPTHMVDLSGAGPIVVDSARVTTSDKSAVFLVLDKPAMRSFYTLELVDPNGNVIVPGVTVGGVPVHVREHNDYRLIRVVFPDIALSSTYVGDWLLRLAPKAGRIPGVPNNNVVGRFGGRVPIGFGAAVASDYKLAVAATTTTYVPGADITLTAALSDRGWPAPNGSVLVDIQTPSGTEIPGVTMYDDSTHGDAAAGDATWTTHFVGTAVAGTYKFFFRASGHNERGELAPRQDTRYVTLWTPDTKTPDGGGGICIPCLWQWALWAAVIGLLLLSLLCCFYRRLG